MIKQKMRSFLMGELETKNHLLMIAAVHVALMCIAFGLAVLVGYTKIIVSIGFVMSLIIIGSACRRFYENNL